MSPPPLISRMALVLLVVESTAVQAMASLSMLALPAIAPRLAEALGLPPALVGFQISLAYGGAMCTSLLAGTMVRRWGAVRTSQIALMLTAAGCLSLALGWLPAMAAGSLLVGFGYGMINPAASHLLMQATTSGNRNLVFSIKQTGVPIGGTLAGAMAPPIAIALGWPWALASVASLGLALAAALQPARARWDHDREPKAWLLGNPLAGLGLIWRVPMLRALSLTGFAYAAVQLSLSTFAVTMLVSDLHWSLVEAGALLAALQVAGVVGRVASGGLADRFFGGSRALVLLGWLTGCLALSCALLGPDRPLWLTCAIMAPFGAFALGWNGIYLAELARETKPADMIPRVTGASLFFTYGGVLVGPPAFAALHQAVGSFTLTYALSALPAFAGAVLLTIALRRR